MAVRKALLVLLMAMVAPSTSTMVTSLPGGGKVEVETSSRGQVCMYITDDYGTIESTQCTSTPGTYTLTGRGGGQARVTVSEFGGISVNTGYFRGFRRDQQQSSGGGVFGAGQQQQQQQQQQQASEDEDNNVRFGSYENPRPAPPQVSYTEAPPAHVARRPFTYRRPLHWRPTALPPTVPPVRVPLIPHTVRPTFGPLTLPRAPPVTEAGLGSVDIIASGPGQLTVFGTGDWNDSELTGPSVPYPTQKPLVARKKRNRLSAASSSDGAAAVQFQAGGDSFSAVRDSDGSTALDDRQNGHRLTSVQSNDGSSVLSHQKDGDSLTSVQSNDGSSVVTSQAAGGQRLGVIRSPDGSVVFSTFIDGQLVNVVRSSDGSSVVSTNIDGRQVTALTSPTGQRLIAGAGAGHNLDAFFNRVMLMVGAV